MISVPVENGMSVYVYVFGKWVTSVPPPWLTHESGIPIGALEPLEVPVAGVLRPGIGALCIRAFRIARLRAVFSEALRLRAASSGGRAASFASYCFALVSIIFASLFALLAFMASVFSASRIALPRFSRSPSLAHTFLLFAEIFARHSAVWWPTVFFCSQSACFSGSSWYALEFLDRLARDSGVFSVRLRRSRVLWCTMGFSSPPSVRLYPFANESISAIHQRSRSLSMESSSTSSKMRFSKFSHPYFRMALFRARHAPVPLNARFL